MQNLNDNQKEYKEIPPGIYDCIIQSVLRKDSNGYELKTKDGKIYQKLRIILLNNQDNPSVFKPIFGTNDIKEVVMGISNPALTHVFNSKSENSFDLENFIGESGKLLLGHKISNGVKYSKVECFIKPKIGESSDNQSLSNTSESFKKELEAADDVPF